MLTQIAADALERRRSSASRVEIGDSALPSAMLAGGSMGTASWGSAVVKALRALREQLDEHGGEVAGEGARGAAPTRPTTSQRQEPLARHAFGAQFAEVRVDADTGEVRVAAHARRVRRRADPQPADRPLAVHRRHDAWASRWRCTRRASSTASSATTSTTTSPSTTSPAYADVEDIEATWIDEDDPHLNPMGAKGIGEIGIVGTAAAIANAVFHATGVRVRDLPIRLDRVLERL